MSYIFSICKGIKVHNILFISMKLLDTIKHLIEEAENNYYEAASKATNAKEIEKLEKEFEDSLRLLEIYKRLDKKG